MFDLAARLPGVGRLCAAFALTVNVAMPNDGTPRLSPVSHRTLPLGTLEHAPIPKWTSGLLFSLRSLSEAADQRPNLVAYRTDGSVVARVRVWFPDTFRLWLNDAAASREGDVLAAVGVAQSVSGEFAGFLALMSPAGAISRVIRTEPFEGSAMTFAPDRTIWVLGLQTGADRSLRRVPEHMIVQQYDARGLLLRQLLPRSEFDCGNWHPAHQQGGRAWILSSAHRIGILTSPACPEWLELSFDGSVLGRWKVHGMPHAAGPSQELDGESRRLLTGVVMMPDGEVYASFAGRRDQQRLFRLRRELGRWEPVPTADLEGRGLPSFSWVVGSDEDALVYGSRGKQLQLVWARLAP